MKTDENYTNRLPEHEQQLELPPHTEQGRIGAGKTMRKAPVAVAAATTRGPGGFGWAALAALAVIVLVGSVFFYSYLAGRSDRGTENTATALSSPTTTTIDNIYGGTLPEITTYATAGTTAAGKAHDVLYLFPFDNSVIAENAALNRLADIASQTGATVTVTAYTDPRGSVAYNQRLSERRAANIGKYLIAHGVPANHIVTKGMGPTNDYPTAQLDRRAVVHINS